MKILVIDEIDPKDFEVQLGKMYKRYHIDHVDTHIGKLNEFIAVVFYDDTKKNLNVDMNMSVRDLNIPTISKNALTRSNIHTVGELIETLQEDPEGRGIRYLGQSGIRAIHKALSDMGVKLMFNKE